jgi:hypothetical protein
MNFDRWVALARFAIGVLGFVFGFFAITSERLATFFIRSRLREMPAAFEEMVSQYRLADMIPDNDPVPVELPPSDKRVRRKDVLAQGLGAYALARDLNRAALARGDDGYVAALMKLITFEPRRSDVALVVLAAATKVPPHTDYLTLEAIRVLAEKGLIGEDRRGAIGESVDQIEKRLRDDHKQTVERIRVTLRRS